MCTGAHTAEEPAVGSEHAQRNAANSCEVQGDRAETGGGSREDGPEAGAAVETGQRPAIARAGLVASAAEA